jgi:hypothetical protein
VVKRIMWAERIAGVHADDVDEFVRAGGMSLPEGSPTEGWKRDAGAFVELSSERFPGSSPVWIWEE